VTEIGLVLGVCVGGWLVSPGGRFSRPVRAAATITLRPESMELDLEKAE